MKKISFLLFAFSILFFTNCSKENDSDINTTEDLKYTVQTPIFNQVPNALLDGSKKGIYHGIIASGTNLTRGKIWINIANDNRYNAYVEMVNGDKISYELQKELQNSKTNTYTFISPRGAFKLNLENFNKPIITNNTLDGEPLLSKVVKGTNGIMPFSFTGTFTDNVGSPTFSGTWNLISTGVMAPEGWGYELINSVAVTFNSTMYSDTSFETFNYPCVGNPALNAQMGSLPGNNNAVISHEQTSNFNGVTQWDLGTGNGTYTNNLCGIISSGSFSWTHNSNGNSKNGFIFID